MESSASIPKSVNKPENLRSIQWSINFSFNDGLISESMH